MSEVLSYYEYLQYNHGDLFTIIYRPAGCEKVPTIITRSPYVDDINNMTEEELVAEAAQNGRMFWERGYAVVFQHCRGYGKSSGECVPYVYDREDGLFLQEWVRKQSFYNGELYLLGSSYTALMHYMVAPYGKDIKGAVLQVADYEQYNCNYRNGFYKIGLHGGWYPLMYKRGQLPRVNYVEESYHMLPLIDFSKTVFGEPAEDFDEIFLHPDRNDEFWKKRGCGEDGKAAFQNANIPILLMTGFNDCFEGGIFAMWNELKEETRMKSALLVHPYDHANNAEAEPMQFEDASLDKQFGNFIMDWMDYARGKAEAPIQPGQVTYYKVFGNEWCTDSFLPPKKQLTFPLGEGEKTYLYNPYAPATFKGGFSANFGGSKWQDPPNSRYDILSFFTPEFAEDTFVKGKMKVTLRVKSDCEDTCFYVRISLAKKEGYYGLRDDIQQISNFTDHYKPGEEIDLTFSFDEHAFVVKEGEKIRVDVSSSAFPLYVRHTNQKGLFSLQTDVKIANNTILCDKSELIVGVETI